MVVVSVQLASISTPNRDVGESSSYAYWSSLWGCRRTGDFMAVQDEPIKEDMMRLMTMLPNTY